MTLNLFRQRIGLKRFDVHAHCLPDYGPVNLGREIVRINQECCRRVYIGQLDGATGGWQEVENAGSDNGTVQR